MPADSPHPQQASITPLPRGRHKLPPEVVTANHRERIFAAMARSLAERGYSATSVQHVIEGAGISRATFYAYFDNKRDCVIAAHEETFERLTARIFRACAGQRQWPLKVKAAIADVLAFVGEDPERARLLILDTLAADLEVARRVLDSNAHLASLLYAGRRHSTDARLQSDLTEEAIIGAISSIASGRLLAGRPLDDLEPQLVTFALTPYIGSAEAERIAAEPLESAEVGKTPIPIAEAAAQS
jgi:AcrR family transcriptional regulator